MAGETIERAAIKLGMKIFDVPRPGRHHDVIALMRKRGHDLVSIGSGRQGFTTSTGRFVDREEALKIAEAASQLLPEHTAEDGVVYRRKVTGRLFSEDIF